MKTTLISLATVLALGTLAGCDQTSDGRAAPQSSAGAGPSLPSSASGSTQANTPTTPANVGQPQTQAEKREGTNPVQQQVDPKAPEQRRDFQMKGDAAGPKQGG